MIRANVGLIAKREDGSEIVNYQNDDFPSYLHVGNVFPGASWTNKPHFHEDLEFITITKGKTGYNINGEQIYLEQGDTLMVNKNQIHYSFTTQPESCSYYIAILHPSLLCSSYFVQTHYVEPIINNQNIPYYADAGVLSPMDRTLYDKDFSKKALDSLSYQGKLYAVPRDISTIVVYYNDSLFSMYNVRKPNADWTLDDLLAKAICLSKDVDNDGKTDFWGVSFEENPPLYYLPYLMSKGGGILSEDGQNMIIDSDESQRGLDFYSNLRNLYQEAMLLI